jgi:hypothetical protein
MSLYMYTCKCECMCECLLEVLVQDEQIYTVHEEVWAHVSSPVQVRLSVCVFLGFMCTPVTPPSPLL